MKFSIEGISDTAQEKELVWGLEKSVEGIAVTVKKKYRDSTWYVFGVKESDGTGFLYSSIPDDLGLTLTKDKETLSLTEEE